MRYDIRDQLSRRDAEITVEIDAPAPMGTKMQFRGNVSGWVTLHNMGSEIAAWGHLETIAVAECGRCLVTHEVPMSFDFSETCSFGQIDEPLAYTAVADDEDTSAIPILDGETVDLSELVRQLLVLNAPQRSLCRPDCSGICPQCGTNLNTGSCDCDEEDIDPRLAPLRNLLK